MQLPLRSHASVHVSDDTVSLQLIIIIIEQLQLQQLQLLINDCCFS